MILSSLLRAFISDRPVFSLPEARYPSGKGEVCKTFMRRFDPDPRLQIYVAESKELDFVGFSFVLIVC